jgi:hypothetical protein
MGGTALDFYNFLARGFYSFCDDKLSNKSHSNRPFPKWSGSDWLFVMVADVWDSLRWVATKQPSAVKLGTT